MARTWRPPSPLPNTPVAFASCPKPQMHRRGAPPSWAALPWPDRCFERVHGDRRHSRRVRLGTPAGELPGDRSSRMVAAHELRRRRRAVLLRWSGPGSLRQPTGRATRRPALVAGVGVGLIGSGMFVTDPVGGSPSRTPGGASLDDAGSGAAPTLAGRLRNLFAIPVFAGIPVAAMASAATAVRSRDYRWAGCSAALGLAVVGSFVMFGSAFGDESRLSGKGGVFHRLSIACGCGWLTALSLRALSYPAH